MSKTVVLPVLALVCLAGPISWAVARDRDRDKLPDRWERNHGLSTKKKNARKDPDGDHLRNRREYKLRLHPRRADSDRDGLRDRAELKRWKTNPRRADTDKDGLNDKAEIKRGTNPRRADSDGDGIKDGAEVRAGSDPTNPASRPTAPPPGSSGPSGFPGPSNVGLPAGWTPKSVRTSNMTISTPGAVIEDVQFDRANVTIAAPNVTLRRVRFLGGGVDNQPGQDPCGNGLLIESSNFEPPPGSNDPVDQEPAIKWGGYTARNVKLWRRGEGWFVSGKNYGCGPVTIESSFAKMVIPRQYCGSGTEDWHTDGVQGYGGPHVTVRNTTIDSREANCGTAPFFYPHSQGNTSATVDGLLVMGGGYPFRLGMPATVAGLKIVNDAWEYGPMDVRCSAVSSWEASLVNIDANYQVTRTVRSLPCNSNGGG